MSERKRMRCGFALSQGFEMSSLRKFHEVLAMPEKTDSFLPPTIPFFCDHGSKKGWPPNGCLEYIGMLHIYIYTLGFLDYFFNSLSLKTIFWNPGNIIASTMVLYDSPTPTVLGQGRAAWFGGGNAIFWRGNAIFWRGPPWFRNCRFALVPKRLNTIWYTVTQRDSVTRYQRIVLRGKSWKD